MNQNEHIAECEKRAREWFVKHGARWRGNGSRIRWSQKGTSICRVYYQAHDRTLLVTGDLGAAVYQLDHKPRVGMFRFMAGCHVEYFAQKCIASESGRGFPGWRQEVALGALKRHIHEALADQTEAARLFNIFLNAGAESAAKTNYEWAEWLSRHDDLFHDPGDACDFFESGRVVALRCVAHHVGLQMAMKQLTYNEGSHQPTPKVGQIPLLADGVRMKPGMELWSRLPDGSAGMSWAFLTEIDEPVTPEYQAQHAAQFWSSREAMEAALQSKADEADSAPRIAGG